MIRYVLNTYSQTCIKRLPLGNRNNCRIRQMASYKRLISDDIFHEGQENATFKYRWLLNRGDHMGRFYCWKI